MTTATGIAPAGARLSGTPIGQGACAPKKWALLQAVEAAREPLGLKGTSVAILRAILSYLPTDHLSSARDEQHICFASNAALAQRAYVSVQTVERHISKLVALGLIQRRSSGNGKRWARRDRTGNITLATGLSVLPLAHRNEEFVKLGQQHQDHQHQISILRSKCILALSELKSQQENNAEYTAFFAMARNTLRRKTNKETLNTLMQNICAKLPESTDNMRDHNPQNEGHKETHLNPSVSEQPVVTIDQMEQSFPTLCKELRTTQTQRQCHNRMTDLANHLAFGKTWHEINAQGPTVSFMVLGYILERVRKIKNPKLYAQALLHRLSSGAITCQNLLTQSPKNDFRRLAT